MFISRLLQAPSLDEKVNLHFIAFVNVGGQLYELGEWTTICMFIYRTYLVIFVTLLIVITLIAHLAVIELSVFVYLDGRKPFPIAHGKTSEATFLEVRRHGIKRTKLSSKYLLKLTCNSAFSLCVWLQDAVGVCKIFMDRDPQEVRFTIIALSKDSY